MISDEEVKEIMDYCRTPPEDGKVVLDWVLFMKVMDKLVDMQDALDMLNTTIKIQKTLTKQLIVERDDAVDALKAVRKSYSS